MTLKNKIHSTMRLIQRGENILLLKMMACCHITMPNKWI